MERQVIEIHYSYTMQRDHSYWVGKARELNPEIRDFIGGRWYEPPSRHLKKHGPRDGILICEYGDGGAGRADQAVSVARQAFTDGRWSRMSVQKRKEILFKFASLLEERGDEFALLECLDVGKPISDALHFDVPAAAACIRFNAEAADKVYGKVYASDLTSLSHELRRPIGVVAGIVGWNFPLYLAAQKIGPVLAAGNSLILKPSEFTSLSASRLAQLALEAGVPEGVLNVVHGAASVGAALAQHHDIDCLTFTGSTKTGKQLLIASGESNMKRLILECGGKAPNIVFSDCANLSAAAEAIVASAFWNQGQVCVATSRLLVQNDIKEELLKEVIRRTQELITGDPLEPATRFGALVSAEHKRKVLAYISQGPLDGARLAYQGPSIAPVEGGFYVPATIFDQVTPKQTLAQEEVFGPVLSVLSFHDEAEAIAIANDTVYGLSATLWTKDVGRAHRISQNLDAGLIVVNTARKPVGGPAEGVLPVGGHKQSGLGLEGGVEGLEAYLKRSTIQIFC